MKKHRSSTDKGGAVPARRVPAPPGPPLFPRPGAAAAAVGLRFRGPDDAGVGAARAGTTGLAFFVDF